MRKNTRINNWRRKNIIKNIRLRDKTRITHIKEVFRHFSSKKMQNLGRLYNISSPKILDDIGIELFHIHTSNEWRDEQSLKTHCENRTFTNPCKLIREQDFERIRNLNYTQYPSRLNCLFLCTKKDIKYWQNKLSDREYHKIFKVKLIEGKLLFVDENIYDQENRLASKYGEEDAIRYWNGKQSKNPIFTALYTGTFIVHEVK